MSLSVKEILSLGKRQLEESGVRDADIDSKLLYCYMMNITRTQLVLEYQEVLQDMLCDKYFALIDRRSKGEPFQYITGSQQFMGFDFIVNEHVLIPRADTENLVEGASNVISGKMPLSNEELDKKYRRKKWDVLDLCTGSGAIGISLAKLNENVNVICTDYSHQALDVAKANAEKNGVTKKIEFREGDLFAPFKGAFKKKKFDMIISNPPYIESDVIDTLEREVREHEPIAALDGGEDGLDFYRRIVEEAPTFMKKNGVLMLEIGHNQGEPLRELLGEKGDFENIQVFKDLAGLDRVVFCTLNSSKKK